ncbi:MAG: branched-chain amino acid ABC transporter permease [Candidatus Rokuibacteriota bacterium]|nr:MAG: branched-chain amino acid ABC transporter permease [Candidatus Rokubacteria bacterium]
MPRRRAEAHRLLPARQPSARGRRPVAAQGRARQGQDRRSGEVPRRRAVARHAGGVDDQRLGCEVQPGRPERQRPRAALHAAVAERPARHGVAGGVHDPAGEVDPARRLGPAQIDVVAQLAVSTVLLGGIYALIAVGLTLIFGIMRVVNFAHGEFLMLGMYLAFFAFTLRGLDPYFVLLIAIPIFFGVGLLTYALVMRGVIHASHNVQIFTTVGLSTVLQNVALVLWSGDFRVIRPWHSSVVLRIFGTAFNLSQVVAFAVAVALTVALIAFMKWTHTGRVMRATAQDRDAATLMGIDTDRVYRLTFAIGIACVGAAGVLVAPLYAAYPQVGLQFVTLAYVVVVLGGLGDMAGAMLGSLIVAAVEVAGSYIFGAAWKEVFYFLLFIGVLVFRPAGIFGQRGAETLGA